MNKINEALEKYNAGFYCSQAVFSSFAKDFGVDEKLALKLSCGFGAGLLYRGEICGAVSGALMVIGLKYGFSVAKDELSDQINFHKSKEFIIEFEKRNGSAICKSLIETDISSQEGLSYARENNIFDIKCPKFVKDSVEILEGILK